MKQEASVADVGLSNGSMAMARMTASAQALDHGQEVLTRISELASRASDPTLSNDDRSILNTEASMLQDELGDVLGNSQFNGQSILQGGNISTKIDGAVTAQDGDGNAIVNQLTGLDLSSQAGATAAMDMVKNAQQSLSENRAVVGASQDRIQRSSVAAANRSANLNQAAAELQNTDVSKEMGMLKNYMVQQKISNAIEKMKNDQAKDVQQFFKD